MEVPDNLLCLFTAQLKEEDGSYIIEVPDQEVTKGQVQTDNMYSAAVLQTDTASAEEQPEQQDQTQKQDRADPGPKPPVEVGEQRAVDIEDIGEQGDGIARVERGYVIIVPDTEVNERVTIKIKSIRPNVAFGEVVEQHDHSE
ncbi:TRAM domain-containing protein [Natrinema sp. H-ect4]|uniref:TRAM domain-containing protein n=1 Tax=Natrinema sp. H-ect4 TaxID=3242699 RepID=UPI0035A894D3